MLLCHFSEDGPAPLLQSPVMQRKQQSWPACTTTFGERFSGNGSVCACSTDTSMQRQAEEVPNDFHDFAREAYIHSEALQLPTRVRKARRIMTVYSFSGTLLQLPKYSPFLNYSMPPTKLFLVFCIF